MPGTRSLASPRAIVLLATFSICPLIGVFDSDASVEPLGCFLLDPGLPWIGLPWRRRRAGAGTG